MREIIAGGETVLVSLNAQELVLDLRVIEQNTRMMARSEKMRKNLNEAARLNSIAESFSTATLMFLKYYGKSKKGEKP